MLASLSVALSVASCAHDNGARAQGVIGAHIHMQAKARRKAQAQAQASGHEAWAGAHRLVVGLERLNFALQGRNLLLDAHDASFRRVALVLRRHKQEIGTLDTCAFM